jgi:hypothetical protein
MTRSCNEPSGYIKGSAFVDQLTDYQFLKQDSVPCSYLSTRVSSVMKHSREALSRDLTDFSVFFHFIIKRICKKLGSVRIA